MIDSKLCEGQSAQSFRVGSLALAAPLFLWVAIVSDYHLIKTIYYNGWIGEPMWGVFTGNIIAIGHVVFAKILFKRFCLVSFTDDKNIFLINHQEYHFKDVTTIRNFYIYGVNIAWFRLNGSGYFFIPHDYRRLPKTKGDRKFRSFCLCLFYERYLLAKKG